MRRYDDPVTVSRGASGAPDRFDWRGRDWQVQEVAAHWVETGPWWTGPVEGDLLGEREVWRVQAARRVGGRMRTDPAVVELAFCWAEGSWRLAGVLD